VEFSNVMTKILAGFIQPGCITNLADSGLSGHDWRTSMEWSFVCLWRRSRRTWKKKK